MPSYKNTFLFLLLFILIFNWQTVEGAFFSFKSKAKIGVAKLRQLNGTYSTFLGGIQARGGVDDYANGGSAPTNRYATIWVACSADNNYCGTGDSGADAKDTATGLVWSMPCNGSGCATFSEVTPLAYSWSNGGANNNSRTASQLCSDHSGWSLPHQKQLMQAYIDGSYGNLDAVGVDRNYWSATTVSGDTTYAWYVDFSYGFTDNNTKPNSSYVRCVRE